MHLRCWDIRCLVAAAAAAVAIAVASAVPVLAGVVPAEVSVADASASPPVASASNKHIHLINNRARIHATLLVHDFNFRCSSLRTEMEIKG